MTAHYFPWFDIAGGHRPPLQFKAGYQARSQENMSGANASPVGRSQENMSGANASPVGRSQENMSGANASPVGRSE